jgi:P4 family phage/plasmid primase-like protien
MDSIIKFLTEHYVDGLYYSHVSLLQPKGRFLFNRDNSEILWDKWCDNIYKKHYEDVEHDFLLGLAEKPGPYMPVLGDIDLKIEDNDVYYNDDEHIYSEEQVKKTIAIHQSVVKNCVEGITDENLICILLEKPVYTIEKNGKTWLKNGFHLHFPNLFMRKNDLQAHIYPRIEQLMKDENVFSELGVEDSGKLIDIKAVTENHWLMYGSVKSPTSHPYLVSKIYDANLNELDLEKTFSSYQLFNLREEMIEVKNKVKYYLPRILSTNICHRKSYELKFGLLSPMKEAEINQCRKENKPLNKVKLSVTEGLKEAQKLIPLLSQSRCEDYSDWLYVGWILYNIGEGSDEALDIWLTFSSKSVDKYDEASCINEWKKMKMSGMTIGSLKFLAKSDNPEGYKQYTDEKIKLRNQKNGLQGTNYDIALLLFDRYGTDYVCSNIRERTWYVFDKQQHRWKYDDEGISLRKKISTEILQEFIEIGKTFLGEYAGDTANDVTNSKMKVNQKIMNNLKTTSFKNNVMKEACELFYNEFFTQKLNTNKYLIGFKNGVYDLRKNVCRAGRPEDYISKSMPINYTSFDESDERMQNVYEFFEKIFPDKELREYFMTIASDVFEGGNFRKKIYFLTGDGNNGKSITQTLFEKMLGEYAIKMNTTVITGKKVANGCANPEMSRAGDGVRWVVFEEPDKAEELNIGIIKNITGSDSFIARDLFQKGKDIKEITPLFKTFFICNKLPPLRNSDIAFWNRCRVIPFESTFVEAGQPCPVTYEEQLLKKIFPQDPDLINKLPNMLEPLAYILLEHRKKVTRLIEPEKVKAATLCYQKENDIYRQFIEEQLIDDNEAFISFSEIWSNFKEWFRESFPGKAVKEKNEVKEYFEKIWKNPINGKWKGHRIKTGADEYKLGTKILLEEDDFAVDDE